MLKIIMAILIWAAMAYPAIAATQTQIDGTFNGCRHNKLYKLTNGMVLICQSYGYKYAYRPNVVVLDSNEVIIDDEKYQATMVAGKVTETSVDGEFEGCDFDKIIKLLNGLFFQCQTYHYHYAYSPKVQIFFIGGIRKVTIDGDEYAGNVFRE